MTLGLARRRPGLPIEVTGFVGRQRELDELAGLLSSARLVTVIGPGGVGKTRVALRAAARVEPEFADGVCLVELSGLHDAELLPNTVASCLGLNEAGTRNRLDAITDYLRDRELLLILDTCEHLVDVCAMFADVLLRATTEVTVLATSRQPLDVPGEHALAVSPLPDAEAAELFAQRAATVVPGFVVNEANRASVVALCRRLDGVPLALELATVRLRALTLEQLTARLEDRFRLLTGGRRATLPHHQTLHAATQWSYDLCTPEEQLLWARLSVFAGSFDIAAAEDVCAGPGLPRENVLPTLIGLVDKSVVLCAEECRRYRLLDSMREFGAEKLAAMNDPTAERHVDRYLAMAERFGEDFTVDQLGRYQQLRQEHDDIRAAIETALALYRDVAASRLVTALFGYWHIAGLPREGRYWTTKVLERFPEPCPARALLLITRCFLVIGAEADGREGIEIAERLGESLIAARGYLYLHFSLAARGRMAEAAQLGAEAERRLEALGDTVGLHLLDAQLSQMHAVAGEAELALARCQRGLRRPTAPNAVWTTSYLHYTTGLALFMQGRYDQAVAAERTALTMKAELGDIMGAAHCLEVLAWVAARQRRHERAAVLLGAADALWQRTGRRVTGNPFLEEFHLQADRALRDALGPERSDTLLRRGALAPQDAIVAFADADEFALPSAASAREATPPGPLTSREHEIATLVAEGLSNREIAHRLVISKRTVDAHIEHIFAKLGVSSRVQLATWFRSVLELVRELVWALAWRTPAVRFVAFMPAAGIPGWWSCGACGPLPPFFRGQGATGPSGRAALPGQIAQRRPASAGRVLHLSHAVRLMTVT
ncbi:MAG TPA: LuxR C-terminal-related transcriptional regulator [Streptosporangiaceae bacterium]